jgi:hypothetical protein
MSRHTVLQDLTMAYHESRVRFEQYADRGQHDRADEYLAEMQEMERCVQVQEVSTSWRRTIEARKRREAEGCR